MNKLQFSSLYQLSIMRFRLTLREPEAIFWVFIFPILLAVGLGIAFRNRPADVLQVAATTPQLTRALAADKGLAASTMDEPTGSRALANGSILLLAIQQPDGVAYQFDDTNPDARTARLLADRAIQSAAGRRNPLPSADRLVHQTGLALHRFRCTRPAGNEPYGFGNLGHRVLHRRGPPEKTSQAPRRIAHASLAVSRRRTSSRASPCWCWKSSPFSALRTSSSPYPFADRSGNWPCSACSPRSRSPRLVSWSPRALAPWRPHPA